MTVLLLLLMMIMMTVVVVVQSLSCDNKCDMRLLYGAVITSMIEPRACPFSDRLIAG
ncbi:hypothetical protein DPMN_075352 [Dreissena polymorpha]|uniref:Uncharacterized protein n=1 Tax=Dreissena polymorpha TaxID=45954 RepID=A0A9D3YKX8_DREPO|nr:hypothetical protein DPMN_075352 [Dreissena polymorpha]